MFNNSYNHFSPGQAQSAGARTALWRRDVAPREPDWSLLREADFSGMLVEWPGAATAHGRRRRDSAPALDLDRALAFAG